MFTSLHAYVTHVSMHALLPACMETANAVVMKMSIEIIQAGVQSP
jgi:hypothetical protein